MAHRLKPATADYKKIVCLGGGIGTSNLIRGLKHFTPHITVVTSMADDGGSSGRLRRMYNMLPPGDLVSCIAALQPENVSFVSQLLTYRFPGNRHKDDSLDGHKLGNLIMTAAYQISGDFDEAIELTKKMFNVTADILPATTDRVRLSAITQDGRRIHGETTLDLAKHSEPYGLKKVYLTPASPTMNKKVIKNMKAAEIIISGPGDLYTNQLPVTILPEIKEILLKGTMKKVFVLNITNKPFETKDFTLRNYVQAFTEHLGEFPFDYVVANNNTNRKIPKAYKYHYVGIDDNPKTFLPASCTLLTGDVVNEDFPIYHDPEKLATLIMKKV